MRWLVITGVMMMGCTDAGDGAAPAADSAPTEPTAAASANPPGIPNAEPSAPPPGDALAGTDAQDDSDAQIHGETADSNDTDSGGSSDATGDIRSHADVDTGDTSGTEPRYALPAGLYLVEAVELTDKGCKPDFASYRGLEWPLSYEGDTLLIAGEPLERDGNDLTGGYSETIHWGEMGFCDCVTTDHYLYHGKVSADGELSWTWDTEWTQTGGTDCTCVGDNISLPCSYLATFSLHYTGQ